MCGIVGYVGSREAAPVIIDGLRRLEYRGYDSAGLAVADGEGKLHLRRAAGKLRNLEEALFLDPVMGHYGVGHTRWATHGRPTEENAHPHRDMSGDICVVHNGIIENYLDLRRMLEGEGHEFKTETDTEVIAHLLDRYSRNGETLEAALMRAARDLEGVFALAAMSSRDPEKVVAARSGPPAIVGLGEDEYFVASDVPAILHYTRDVFSLADNDVAVLTRGGVRIVDFDGRPVNRPVERILWDPVMAEKGGFKHYMLKEIFEQPRAVRDTIVGRVNRHTHEAMIDEMDIGAAEYASAQQVRLLACGSSWHAAMTGKYMIERLAGIQVEVDYGSEFRYREPIVLPGTLAVVISQSGETADSLAAQREAKRQGLRTLAICNVLDSMMTREADSTLYTLAGPEIGVAASKTFTTQLAALFLLALFLGQARKKLTAEESERYVQELLKIPSLLESVLGRDREVEELARKLYRSENFLFLGRGIHFPIALEGALKLKEISYIHAEGYAAGEMKHGPNALIDEDLPVVVLAAHDPNCPNSRKRYDKTLANIKEVQARQGRVVAIANEGDTQIHSIADEVIETPLTIELLQPILEIVPLQLLAYHIAVLRGCDVDQPRNLAKSVTVE